MSRPLIVTDCDEVLLHMVVPFRAWLDEAHGIHFDLERGSFVDSLRHKHDGSAVDQADIWPLLDRFFASEMHRQGPIDGAVEAIGQLARIADIVVLTNLLDHRREARAAQLGAIGIDAPVHTNQGGKGEPLARIVAERSPSLTIFIDDLATHHESVARAAPDTWRLHFVGEPLLAPHYPPAPHAHARFDAWAHAHAWIASRIAEGARAPALPTAA